MWNIKNQDKKNISTLDSYSSQNIKNEYDYFFFSLAYCMHIILYISALL